MTVTKVEDYINGRYKIDIDGAFAFVLYKGELRRYQIKEGELLSGEAYREIMESVLPKRAKLRAMHLLKVSDRTEADVRRRLKDGCYPEQAIDEVIIYLKSYHYIDDRRYAEGYIASKSDRLSRCVIKQKLRQKGIPADLIDEKLSAYALRRKKSERALIRRLMLKKCENPAAIGYDEKNRLFSYLYHKGFSICDITDVYKKFINSF